jgi:hypothetical protein
MPPQTGPDRMKMGEAHEAHIAEAWGGARQRGSGSQWSNPADVREDRTETEIAVAADGKSTTSQSIAIKKADLRKLVEQAGGEIPVMPVRFYDDYRLQDFEDWVLLRERDALAWRAAARAAAEAPPEPEPLTFPKAEPAGLPPGYLMLSQEEHDALVSAARAVAVPPGSVIIDARELLELRTLSAEVVRDRELPPGYLDIVTITLPGEPPQHAALLEGKPFAVRTIRIEDSVSGVHRLFVNEQQVRNGKLTQNGVVRSLVGQQPRDPQ